MIIISQNIDYFAIQWGCDLSEVFNVIAITGIGKLIVLLFSGYLSDRIGRKPVVLMGMISFIIFFIGLAFSNNITQASIFGFLGGAAASFLDGATYPALMEIYTEDASKASIIVKGFISIAGLSPIIINFIHKNNIWFGWTLIVPAFIIILNMIYMLFLRFPNMNNEKSNNEIVKLKEKPKFYVEGILLILYSFFIYATFYIWQQTVPVTSIKIANMSEDLASLLIPLYSIGSISAVILTSIILTKKISDVKVVLIYSIISFISVLITYIYPTNFTFIINSFVLGFFAAGGVYQIGNVILNKFFPSRKGLNTSIYSVFMAFSTYIVPVISKNLIKTNITQILLMNVLFAIICVIITFVIQYRSKLVFEE